VLCEPCGQLFTDPAWVIHLAVEHGLDLHELRTAEIVDTTGETE
jgi:hypothetical protein